MTLLCKLMKVSRGGFYRWKANQENPKPVDPETFKLEVDTQEIFAQSGESYGERRLAKALCKQGHQVGRHRAKSLMKKLSLKVKKSKKHKVTTNSKHKHPVADNLLDRQFNIAKPNTAYVADITYLWTREGWVYLAVIMDLFSRQVIGWQMSSRMTTELPLHALRMAYWSRKPARGVLHHSDRGSQYASSEYQSELKKFGVVTSMSRKGNCWDNAPMERFFGSLKRERTDHYIYNTRAEVEQHVVEYIMFYNNKRLHSTLGYMSPVDYEKQAA